MAAQEKIRLQVYMSRNGVCSRRKAFVLVQEGKVKVNGKLVTEPSHPVIPGKDLVSVGGKRIESHGYVYLMMNKPWGTITTRQDRYGEKTVIGLLPKEYQTLHPVGRLDKNTEGLLILTNDGDLTYHLTHPRFSVDKEYHVMIKGDVQESELKRLEKGVMVDDRKTAPAQVSKISKLKDKTTFHLTIHEGRKRQIRRMLLCLGYQVNYLKRMRQGSLSVGRLKPGEFRKLSSKEISYLKSQKRKPAVRGLGARKTR